MKKKKAKDEFLKYLRQYFTIHLPHQRQSSPHTIIASRQTWNMFLGYVVTAQKTKLEKLTFDSINQEVLYAFLAEMQIARGWSKSTYNQRLSCIRSFYKYVGEAEPLLAMYRQDISAVHLLKTPRIKPVSYLSDEVLKILFEQPDTSTRIGIRDLFFMVLAFDSAARCGELLNMTLGDVNVAGRSIQVMGKGEKPRIIPLVNETIEHFVRYADAYHARSDSKTPLIYTIHRQRAQPMSHDNVERFMEEYSLAAHAICCDVPVKVRPHQLRHSRAMSLYRSGMPLALLSEWLGHEDPETTLMYAYADIEMKREAIEKASMGKNTISPPNTERIWEGNEDMIQRLCGLS
jgi:site-specific recombinase XerD